MNSRMNNRHSKLRDDKEQYFILISNFLIINLNNNTIERSYEYPISNYSKYISYLYTRDKFIKVQRKKGRITERRIPISSLSFIRARVYQD